MEITTTTNGFIMNQKNYEIIGEKTPQTETQAHIETDLGTILFDLTMVIDGKTYNNIQSLINSLPNG